MLPTQVPWNPITGSPRGAPVTPSGEGGSDNEGHPRSGANSHALATIFRWNGWRRQQRFDLRGVDLQRADLQRAYLKRANLPDARLKDSNLQRAYLMEAHLEGANLAGAHLEEADLSFAHLEGANLRGAYLKGLMGLNYAHREGVIGLREPALEWVVCMVQPGPWPVKKPRSRKAWPFRGR